MAQALFFWEDLDIHQKELEISGEEARHILAARRLQAGDIISLTDGKGLRANARIIETNKKNLLVSIHDYEYIKPAGAQIIIASALPKGERQSDMLDQCTQAGMDYFIPMQCEFSVAKVKDNSYERFGRIIRSAAKQSQRSVFPQVSHAMSLQNVLNHYANDAIIFYADLEKGDSLFQLNQGIMAQQKNWLCLIGPEGGFSAPEFSLIEQSGAVPISLSTHILRTETAAVLSTAILTQIRIQQKSEE